MDVADAAAGENGVFAVGLFFSSGGDEAANHQLLAVAFPHPQLVSSGYFGHDRGGGRANGFGNIGDEGAISPIRLACMGPRTELESGFADLVAAIEKPKQRKRVANAWITSCRAAPNRPARPGEGSKHGAPDQGIVETRQDSES